MLTLLLEKMTVVNGTIVSDPLAGITSRFTATFTLDNGQVVTYTANLNVSVAGFTSSVSAAKLTYTKVSDLTGDRRYQGIIGNEKVALNVDPVGTTITADIIGGPNHGQSVSGTGNWLIS